VAGERFGQEQDAGSRFHAYVCACCVVPWRTKGCVSLGQEFNRDLAVAMRDGLECRIKLGTKAKPEGKVAQADDLRSCRKCCPDPGKLNGGWRARATMCFFRPKLP
jgi:hypothetical protein